MASKQMIILRKDLGMRKGKMVAQGAHASLAAILNQASRIDTPKVTLYEIECDNDSPLHEWIEGNFAKICVSVDSEEELLDVYNKAKEAGLICALIKDAGLTEFHGVPTLTCCAIGPAKEEDVDKITGHLKLL